MHCRVSGEPLKELINLGDIYLNAFPTEVDESLPKSPLRVGIGEASRLCQLYDTPDQDALYREYWYRSGTNESMIWALKDVATGAQRIRPFKKWDIVLDIGCNDGTLLRQFPQEGITVGIDPAKNLADDARSVCDYHYPDYFTAKNYKLLMGDKKPNYIMSIAMFYDLDDPQQFVKDIKEILADDGLWVVQMSYTPLMLEQNAFDNICHEHLEYYTLESFCNLLSTAGLQVVDAEFNSVNGGSIRCYVMHEGAAKDDFEQDVADMRLRGMYNVDADYQEGAWDGFVKRVERLKENTLDLLCELKTKRKRVYGYGASTKGNTLLQYYGIDGGLISAISERQMQKVGRYTVGSWIPIISDEQIRRINPDYLFVFPWHFIDNFKSREQDYLRNGGRFIVPLPELEIIDG